MDIANTTLTEEFINEEMMEKAAHIEARVVFTVIFIEWMVSLILRDKHYRFTDSVASMLMVFMEGAPRLALVVVKTNLYIWVYKNFLIVEVSLDTPFKWIVVVFFVDFLFYWYHRAMHEVNILWMYHQHHHSGEEMNITAAIRQPYLQDMFGGIFSAPLALFVKPWIGLSLVNANIHYQLYVHSAYFKSLGPLEYIMNTPSHHRVHHARNRNCIDRNYAGMFIIWDRMFGTFTPESDVKDVRYGLVTPVNTFDIFTSQCRSVFELFKKVLRMKGVTNKIKAVLYGPGWRPGKPRLGNLSEIPEVEHPRHVYETKIPPWLKYYVTIHIVMTLLMFSRQQIPNAVPQDTRDFIYLLKGWFVMFSVCTIGRLMDGSKWSSATECVRCVCTIGLHLYESTVVTSYGLDYRTRASDLRLVLLFLSTGLWIARIIYYKSTYTHYGCTKAGCKFCNISKTK